MEKLLKDIQPLFMERFKKSKNNYPQTLFGMDWKMLEKKRCVWCGNKLVEMRKAPQLYCKSKRHKRFIIQKDKV